MKNLYFIGFIALILFTGCRKNEDEIATSNVSTINAVVLEGNDSIAVVKLLVNGIEVAKSDYCNGGFSINLPENIDSELKPFASDIPQGYKVSNRNAQFVNATLAAYNKNDKQIGKFNYLCYELVINNGELYYVLAYESGLNYLDSDVIVTGSEREADGDYTSINVNLKKGWNFVYSSGWRPNPEGGHTNELTTERPSGTQWFFTNPRY
ncbi:MAG: hypothetical protein LBU92_03515 [Prevotellaceae bacterium]|jgi:hypothetical protein|nr:hypothetical protein [Prevotellaceae bacterium]